MADAIPNRGPELMGVNIAFLVAALISILLRCYVRAFMVKAFGVDDWLMVVAAVFFTLYAACSTTGVQNGTGRHHADLETEEIQTAMMYWWFCYLWYSLTMATSKISIGWFLLRVATNKIHRLIIYGAMGATALSCAVFFFVTLFQCSPISYFWNEDQPGQCVDIEVIIALAILYSVFAVISDFIFAILPGVIVWKLQLHKRTKLLLLPLLAMGCVASSAVIARFPYLPKFREPDFLWNTTDIAIWSTVEQGLAISAGSLATLRPLVKALGSRLGFTSNPTAAYGGSHGLTSPRAPRSAQLGGKSGGDAYRLGSVSRDGLRTNTGDLESKGHGHFSPSHRSETKCYAETGLTRVGDNDSEEALNSPEPWSEFPMRRER